MIAKSFFATTASLAFVSSLTILVGTTQANAMTCNDPLASDVSELRSFSQNNLNANLVSNGVLGQPDWSCDPLAKLLGGSVTELLPTSDNLENQSLGYRAFEQALSADATEPMTHEGELHPYIQAWISMANKTSEKEWVAENFDDPNAARDAYIKELKAQLGLAGEGFEAAGIAMKGVLLFEARRAKTAIDKDPYELIEGAFGVQEALQPTLDELEQQSADIRRASEESKDARAERKYYEAEIGSDDRRSNLQYDEAQEGYRYSRELEQGTFTDEHGTEWETERRELPAEHNPDLFEDIGNTG